jgi:putative two-component system response regulator
MRSHTTIGARILADSQAELLRLSEQIALNHHERWDGKGYPNGIAGEAIPIEARIVSVADVFDALTSKRPYKRAFEIDESVKIIQEGAGTQFEPRVVEAFLSIVPKAVAIKEKFPQDYSDTASYVVNQMKHNASSTT